MICGTPFGTHFLSNFDAKNVTKMEPKMGPKSYENETLEHRNNGARLGAVRSLQTRPDRDLVPKRHQNGPRNYSLLGSVLLSFWDPFLNPLWNALLAEPTRPKGPKGPILRKRGSQNGPRFGPKCENPPGELLQNTIVLFIFRGVHRKVT